MIAQTLRIRWLGAALAGLAMACEPSAGTGAGSVAPGGAHDGALAGEGRQEGESAEELERRLHTLVGEQQRLIEPANSEPDTCEDLCSLATSICGVQEKLCNLADRHPTEANYTRLCREAKQECREAQESCVRCVERHAAVARPPAESSTRAPTTARPQATAAEEPSAPPPAGERSPDGC